MSLFAEFDQQTTLVVIAVIVVVTWMLLMRSQRYFGRQRSNEPAEPREAKPAPTTPAAHGELPESLSRWEVEMHETARQMAAQLDSKMSALQALIADADRAAARLEAAQSGTSLPSGKPQDAPAPAQNPSASLKLPSDARREEVCTLSDYGFAAADIASRIDVPLSEVEAILGARGKK
jgi:hypothetical protein